MIKYEATRSYAPTSDRGYYQTEQEFDTKEEAQAWVENGGATSGQVITWHVGPNLPRCLPELVYSSCALDVWQEGKWRGVNIHG